MSFMIVGMNEEQSRMNRTSDSNAKFPLIIISYAISGDMIKKRTKQGSNVENFIQKEFFIRSYQYFYF